MTLSDVAADSNLFLRNDKPTDLGSQKEKKHLRKVLRTVTLLVQNYLLEMAVYFKKWQKNVKKKLTYRL